MVSCARWTIFPCRPKLDIDSLLSEKLSVDKARKERAEKAAEEASKATSREHLTAADFIEGDPETSPNTAKEGTTRDQGKHSDARDKPVRDAKRMRTSVDDTLPFSGKKPSTGKDGATEKAAATAAAGGKRTARGKKQGNVAERSEAHEPSTSSRRSDGTGWDEGKGRDEAQPQADVDQGGGIGDELARALRPTDEVEKVEE